MKALGIVVVAIFTITGGLWMQYTQSAENWKMLIAQDGVEFYVLHKESHVSEHVNTVIKVVNQNAYEVNVSFVPSFTCGTEAAKIQAKTTSTVGANGASTLHNYKSCLKGVESIVSIRSVEITKR
ncbi:MAG: hypothetical protein NZ521_00035 [Flammeovirgaceae bacterium]|nr:hypothetical protein [Flammeovirgaceae bacterium]MDW8286442.1 hypothetical protein [Flammeovirgaceae bacterium]